MTPWLYTGLCYASVPLAWLHLHNRARKQPAYKERIHERFGRYKSPAPKTQLPVLWLHCVSVGETIAAKPLVEALLSQANYQILITSTTPTGSQRVQQLFGDNVWHTYVPYDIPKAINAFLDRFRPTKFLVMETELWPNILAACKQREIKSYLINGRLSLKSATGYRRLGALMKSLLANLDSAQMQYEADAQRIIGLGMAPTKVAVTGSIKFDIQISPQQQELAQSIRSPWRGHPVILAASTHRGEDEQVLQAFTRLREIHPALKLILVPRHPERCEDVIKLCANYHVCIRSGREAYTDADILLVDTIGELMLLYGACDIAFVGGSLVNHGGHNLIEPAAWGKVVCAGPHVFNFAEIANQMLEQKALVSVDNANDLAEKINSLLEAPALCDDYRASALKFATANRGALQRLLDGINNPPIK